MNYNIDNIKSVTSDISLISSIITYIILIGMLIAVLTESMILVIIFGAIGLGKSIINTIDSNYDDRMY